MSTKRAKKKVIIIGAGLAGLSCALRLLEQNYSVEIIESSDDVGGRVRTDSQDGFLLDRGFQVLLTAYPEAQRLLNYKELSLKAFYKGALVRVEDQFQKLADPFRHPFDALLSAFSTTSTLADKLRVGELRRFVSSGKLEELFEREEQTTKAALRKLNFSEVIIERFFRPFFGGIFLEKELMTSSRMFEFTYRMFSQGDATLPARGMSAIPDFLASKLPAGTIRLNTRVSAVDSKQVTLANGDVLETDSVVIATSQSAAAKLLNEDPPATQRDALCIYFAAKKSPINGLMLVLNGDSSGPINNLCIPSSVAPEYAPANAALISVSIVGDLAKKVETGGSEEEFLLASVEDQLRDWFGPQTQDWRHLKTYKITDALPAASSVRLCSPERTRTPKAAIYICGDHLDTPSINGALRSGRVAAETLIEDLAGKRSNSQAA